MKKVLLIFILTVNNITAQIELFNGKNLDGWKIHGTELWYVEDGLLVCESGPDKEYGYLSTNEFYDDFELTLEFKQEANGNSEYLFVQQLMEQKLVVGRLKLLHLAVILEVFMNPMEEAG